MTHQSYASLSSALGSAGLVAQQGNPHQLIVSVQRGPVWPDRGNSFWVSIQDGTWYLSTWLPACYRVPESEDIVALCCACMESGTSAMYRVPDAIASRFGLEEISDSEFDELFAADEDERG